MSESRKEFGRVLGAIEDKVTGLFGMVTEDLPVATQAAGGPASAHHRG